MLLLQEEEGAKVLLQVEQVQVDFYQISQAQQQEVFQFQ
jgi:hypothetical protein